MTSIMLWRVTRSKVDGRMPTLERVVAITRGTLDQDALDVFRDAVLSEAYPAAFAIAEQYGIGAEACDRLIAIVRDWPDIARVLDLKDAIDLATVDHVGFRVFNLGR